MIKVIKYFIQLFVSRKSYKRKDKLENSNVYSSRFFSSHEKRKLASLKSDIRKKNISYSKMLTLKAYEISYLMKEGDTREITSEIDNLIKTLIDWRVKLSQTPREKIATPVEPEESSK
jgi:hypothetical protein